VQGGAIQRQVNDQLFEIDQKQRDLENQYIQLLTQTKVEKENTLTQIKNDYGQKLAYIRSLQASLPREKAEALSTLARELKNEALGRLVSLENWYRQREADLTSWANDRMNVLQSYKQQLSQTSDFSPQDIIWNNLKPVDNSGGTGTEVYTPSQLLALAKRRREELIG
jgi:ribosomal protein L16 Arg81 hydroxylase